MSSIKLSPNASGTGEFTIAAPNSNTNRTLTLPDQTGTVVTTSADALNIGSGQLVKDASGNVGIGTSSPSKRLQVESSASEARVRVVSALSGSLYYSGLEFARSGVTGGALIETARNASSGGVGFSFYTTADNAAEVSGTYTERARIDSSGNLLVGKTSASSTVVGVNLSGTGGENYFVYGSVSGGQTIALNRTASTGAHILFQQANNTVGSVTVTASSTAYNTSSDYRLKHDIQPMTGALAKVAALKPVTYKWNVDNSAGEGFIAHELQAVVPDAVTGEKDAVDAEGKPVYQGIDTSFLVATLTAALQELNAKVEAQAAEIAALKGAQ